MSNNIGDLFVPGIGPATKATWLPGRAPYCRSASLPVVPAQAVNLLASILVPAFRSSCPEESSVGDLSFALRFDPARLSVSGDEQGQRRQRWPMRC